MVRRTAGRLTARLVILLLGWLIALSLSGCSVTKIESTAPLRTPEDPSAASTPAGGELSGGETDRVRGPTATADPGIGEGEAITTPERSVPTKPERAAGTTPTAGQDAPLERVTANRIWGIETYSMLDQVMRDRITDSGIDWVRRNAVFWSEVERVQGTRDWSVLADLELELVSAAEQEVEVVLLVRSTPGWAQAVPGLTCGPIDSIALPVFADFMAELVSKYSQAPYHVRYYEIWNEPDVIADARFIDPESPFGCWGDNLDPFYGGRDYAEVLAAVYPRVKAANPEAQVLVGGLLLDCDPVNPPNMPEGGVKDCSSAKYLEGILQAGGGNYFDGVSYHAYDYYSGEPGQYGNSNWGSSSRLTGPVLHAKTRFLRSLLNRYGVPDRYLINSESGLICGTTDGSEPACQSDEFKLTKAYYAAVAYAGAIAERLEANIWYSLRGWRGSGLLDREGQPQVVYDALAFSRHELRSADFSSRITQYQGVSGYEFNDSGKTIWLIWSAEGVVSVELPEQPSAVFDVFGGVKANDIVQQVTTEPIYVEWDG